MNNTSNTIIDQKILGWTLTIPVLMFILTQGGLAEGEK